MNKDPQDVTGPKKEISALADKELREEVSKRDEMIVLLNKSVEFLQSQVLNLNRIVAARDEGIEWLRMEVSRHSSDPADQRLWWDEQFRNSWEANSGPAQSRYFMTKLIGGLKSQEQSFLSSRRLQFLDWGCATGDGSNVFATKFPNCEAFGVDVSSVAIAKAHEKFPGINFIQSDRGQIENSFDVVLSSNCLEHFDAPLEWLGQLLRASRLLVVVLVPYREHPLIEGHKVSFSEESFPEVFRGFRRLYTTVQLCDPQYWAGSQIAVVYGSSRYFDELNSVVRSATHT